jgi:hypothetical protein
MEAMVITSPKRYMGRAHCVLQMRMMAAHTMPSWLKPSM